MRLSEVRFKCPVGHLETVSGLTLKAQITIRGDFGNKERPEWLLSIRQRCGVFFNAEEAFIDFVHLAKSSWVSVRPRKILGTCSVKDSSLLAVFKVNENIP